MTGEDLRTLRTAHTLTQRQMGLLLGYTANYVARLERGDAPITARFATLVRHVLGQRRAKKRDGKT